MPFVSMMIEDGERGSRAPLRQRKVVVDESDASDAVIELWRADRQIRERWEGDCQRPRVRQTSGPN